MGEQTVGKVPPIRFKGFEGKWDQQALGELFSITSAARVHKHEWRQSGVPFFRSSDVVCSFKGDENNKAFISHELYEALSAKVGRVKSGDILVTGGGSIGIPYLVRSDKPLYFKDADLLWFKIRQTVDGYYLYTFFTSQPFRRYLNSISHIGTIAHYTVQQAKGTPVTLPRDSSEQTQIGDYFRALDGLIGLHQRKHGKLVTLKKAMLQKMFPQPGATVPEIRFKGFKENWGKVKLGTVASLINGRAYSQGELLKNGKYKVLRVGNFYTNSSWYFSDMELADKFYAQTGDLLYTWSASFGPHVWNGEKIIFHYHIWKIELTDSINREFLLQLLENDKDSILSNSNGSTMIHITKGGMELKEFVIPHVTEQQKIGTYFRTLDTLISQHATQLQKLQQIKSACLEKMFV